MLTVGFGGCGKKKPVEIVPNPDSLAEARRRAMQDSLDALARAREDSLARARAAAEAAQQQVTPLTLEDIHFDYDKSSLRPDAETTMSSNAAALQQHPEASVTIEGHCDERGTNEYNLALGERRAGAAKDYLVNYGIDAGRLTTVSYGEERPLDPGHDESAWSRNRRDHFEVKQ